MYFSRLQAKYRKQDVGSLTLLLFVKKYNDSLVKASSNKTQQSSLSSHKEWIHDVLVDIDFELFVFVSFTHFVFALLAIGFCVAQTFLAVIHFILF